MRKSYIKLQAFLLPIVILFFALSIGSDVKAAQKIIAAPSTISIPGGYNSSTGSVSSRDAWDKDVHASCSTSVNAYSNYFDLSGVGNISFSVTANFSQGNPSNHFKSWFGGSASCYMYLLDGNNSDAVIYTWGPGAYNNSDIIFTLRNSGYDLSNVRFRVSGSGGGGDFNYCSTAVGCNSITINTMATPVVVTDIPANRNYNFQDELKFTITASGATPLSYQWYENDTAIAGATSPTLDLGVQEGLRYNGSRIYCEVTNNLGSATSQTCALNANVGTFKPSISASSLTTLNFENNAIMRLFTIVS